MNEALDTKETKKTNPRKIIPENFEIVYDEKGAAKLLKMQELTVRTWRSRGKGPPYVKINGAVRYFKSSIVKWMREHEYDV